VKHASAVTATGWLHEPRADAGLHFLREDDTWRYLTYEDLAGRVAAMAEVLRDQGLAGRRLGMVGETSEDFIVQYFATLATGGTCIPIPFYLQGQDRPTHDRLVAAVLQLARPYRIFGTDGSQAFEGWPVASVPSYGRLPAVGQVRITDSDAPAIVQFTSGSTGVPKGVRMSRSRLDAGLTSARDWLGISPADRWATWMPVWLLKALTRPIASQCDTMCMTSMQFVQRPERWLRCFGELGCTITIAAALGYHHAVNTVPPETLTGCRFGGWRVAGVIGEPLRAADLDGFVNAFGQLGFRRRAFCPIYGMTEASRMIAATRPEEEPVAFGGDGGSTQLGPGPVLAEMPHPMAPADRMIGAGRPLTGVLVKIRLPDGAEAPEGALGEVCVGGEALADGYEDDEDFGEWLPTGDVGCLHDGVLFVFGRLVDSFQIRGSLVLAERAETAVQRAAPEASSIVVVPNRAAGAGITVVAESSQPWPTERIDEVRRTVSDLFNKTEVDLLIVAPGGIPRTATGKPRRKECWARYVLARS